MSGARRAARGATAWLLGAVVGVVAVAGPLPARAHERSVSYARLAFDAGGAEIALRIDSRELTRLPVRAGDTPVDEQIAGALRLRRGNEDCARSGSVLRTASAGGRETLQWRVDCSVAGQLEIDSALPQLLGTAHLCFVVAGSELEVVLDRESPLWRQHSDAGDAGAPPRAFFDSFRLGVEHIAGGLDHLLFVFGLVVVATSLAEAAVVITAFTLAHMLTLAAAALGLLRPPAAPVEALIAMSIGLIAVENLTLRGGARERRATVAAAMVMAPALAASALGLGRVPIAALAGTALFAVSYLALAESRPDARRLRWVVAFTFGLLHGFGFAGVLVEAGFSGDGVMTRLLAFNAGVEAGQLVFVAMLWPLIALMRHRFGHRFPRVILEPASVALLAASVAWYVTRTFG